MHDLAAYSFEASLTASQAEARVLEIDVLLDEWLIRKGADNPTAANGAFVSKSGDGTGQFSRAKIATGIGTLREIELIETAHTGEMFTTALHIAYHAGVLSVFATLSITPASDMVAPMALHPRCPAIIRTLVQSFPDWTFGGQPVPLDKPFPALTKDDVYSLCDALEAPDRRLPLVIVSADSSEMIWPELPTEMAKHLIGLADVAYVDADSSWTLTDELGKQDSCYLGAVRLYWPGVRHDGSLRGQTWAATRLATFGEDSQGMARFLAAMRKTVMSTAALMMTPPKGVREIQRAASRERLKALEADVREHELNHIVEENAKLSEDLTAAYATIADLQVRLNAYKSDAKDAEREAAAEQSEDDEPQEMGPPVSGETRFYKKTYSGGGVDNLVRTKRCNHRARAWKPAFAGDQAEKGISKLEGISTWQSIWHCATCTGGGRWQVVWK